MIRGRLFLRVLLCLGFAAFLGCARAPQVIGRESFVFGTRVEILLAGVESEEEKSRAEAAIREVLRDFDALHRKYHAWQPSALTAVNEALAAGKALDVDAEMAGFIRQAADYARRGRFRFDPGIGRLIALWGFQSDEFAARLPDQKALAEWRANPASIAQLRLGGNHLSSENPAVALDFGGYLKGAALDRAARRLKAAGFRHALINIGGNVMALGEKNGAPWKIGVQHPRQPGALALLDLRDGEAIGTSGDYQRYFELDGRRYSHLLDPKSGEPVAHTQAVTVLIVSGAESGVRSDVFSKPIFIAGDAAWQEAARDLDARHVLRVRADGALEVTEALYRRLRFPGTPPPLVVVP
ncbi:MAG: FAD:protein FMN transferase [Zoogloeaceae bacterium]|jgi:thiamine biosynthesis lipoprotein|nr:FAD:protein FMN transferase [Zoogloeaceae bacterium]